jgi:hypothetical protein
MSAIDISITIYWNQGISGTHPLLHELRHRAIDLIAPDLPIVTGVQLSARHRRDSKTLSDHGLLWESLSGLPELSRATYQGELIRWGYSRP